MAHIFKNILIVLVLALVVGCTRESLCGCIPVNKAELTFSFTMNVSGEDKFTKEVSHIDLFVFDSNGLLIQKESGVGPFDSRYAMSVDLPAGIYTFVVWGGLGKSYGVRQDNGNGDLSAMELNKTTLAQSRLVIEDEKTVINTQLSPLFYGMSSNVEVLASGPTTSNISLLKNTNAFKTSVIDVQAVKSESVDLFYIGTNSRFDFLDNIAPQAIESRYEPYTSSVEGTTLATHTVLPRLILNQPLMLKIVRGGTLLHQENLPQLLIDIVGNGIDSQEDLDRNDSYDISVDIQKINSQITITVNGWKIIRVIGEIE